MKVLTCVAEPELQLWDKSNIFHYSHCENKSRTRPQTVTLRQTIIHGQQHSRSCFWTCWCPGSDVLRCRFSLHYLTHWLRDSSWELSFIRTQTLTWIWLDVSPWVMAVWMHCSPGWKLHLWFIRLQFFFHSVISAGVTPCDHPPVRGCSLVINKLIIVWLPVWHCFKWCSVHSYESCSVERTSCFWTVDIKMIQMFHMLLYFWADGARSVASQHTWPGKRLWYWVKFW